MKEIIFTYNWNKKLDCRCFTSLRLSDKYKVGDECKIIQQSGKEIIIKGIAKIIDIKKLSLDQVNTFIAHLDTGYDEIECRKTIVRMYPKADWQTQKLKLILFKYIPN